MVPAWQQNHWCSMAVKFSQPNKGMELGPGSGGLSSKGKNGLGYNAVMGYPMGLASRHISGLTERRERASLESWVVMQFKTVTLEQKGGTGVGKKLPLRNAMVAIHPDRDASGRRTAQLMAAADYPEYEELSNLWISEHELGKGQMME